MYVHTPLQTWYMCRGQRTSFWESVPHFHHRFLGSDSSGQICVASPFTQWTIFLTLVLLFISFYSFNMLLKYNLNAFSKLSIFSFLLHDKVMRSYMVILIVVSKASIKMLCYFLISHLNLSYCLLSYIWLCRTQSHNNNFNFYFYFPQF